MSDTQTNGDLARYWNVAERTVKRWRAAGAPLDNNEAMADWFSGDPRRMTDGVMSRLAETRGAGGGKRDGAQGAAEVDPDWAEFRSTLVGEVDDDPKKAMAAVSRARAFAAFKFDKASQSNHKPDIKFYSDLLAKLDGTLHDQQLRAKKLGLDTGDLVPRPEVERILRAWAFWAMRSVDSDLADLCPKLTGKAQVDEVRGVLEPALLSARFLKPFARAARIESPSAVPEWMVDVLRDAVDDYIEDGAAAFSDIGEPAPATA